MNLERLARIAPWEWPAGTAKVIHDIIVNKDADEDDRLLAIEMASQVTNFDDQLALALLNLARDADASIEMRCDAAISLGPVLELADVHGFDEDDLVPISEAVFQQIVDALHKLYTEANNAKLLRRRALETAVRAPREWQDKAVRAGYKSGDREWQLSAVFAMRWLPGFERQILEALDADDDQIVCEAVQAAGNWEIDDAWHPIEALLDEDTEKRLLLVAIEAAASIRPALSIGLLIDFTDSEDDDIATVATEAISMARALDPDEDDLDEFDDVDGDPFDSDDIPDED